MMIIISTFRCPSGHLRHYLVWDNSHVKKEDIRDAVNNMNIEYCHICASKEMQETHIQTKCADLHDAEKHIVHLHAQALIERMECAKLCDNSVLN